MNHFICEFFEPDNNTPVMEDQRPVPATGSIVDVNGKQAKVTGSIEDPGRRARVFVSYLLAAKEATKGAGR